MGHLASSSLAVVLIYFVSIAHAKIGPCTLNRCVALGADYSCIVLGDPSVRSCGTWKAKFPELSCPKKYDPVLSNTGQVFDNMCLLRKASYETKFKTFGPVAGRPNKKLELMNCGRGVCTHYGRLMYCRDKGTEIPCGRFKAVDCGKQFRQSCPLVKGGMDSTTRVYDDINKLVWASCKTGFRVFGPIDERLKGLQ